MRHHGTVSVSNHPSSPTTRAQMPELLAAIDLGTNSFHMLIARSVGDQRFETITRHKEMVRLGESGDYRIRELTELAMQRGIDALKRCKSLIDASGAEYVAVATSAVREANNGKAFIARARDEAGIEVNLISGHEEARLIYLGVLQSLPVYDDKVVLCDIGGGSTEVLIGKQGEVRRVRSFKLGAIRTTQRFFKEAIADDRSIKAARRYIADTLAGFGADVKPKHWKVAVATSGTASNIFSIALAKRGEDVTSLSGATMSAKEVRSVVADIVAARTPEDRLGIEGLDAKRSDIIIGGALIFEAVTELCGVDTWQFSEGALREGALFDLAQHYSGAGASGLVDLQERSIEHLMELCEEDPAHSIQLARLAVQLFDGLGELHHLGAEERELLWAGACLSNIGLFVAHSRHHHHSYYMIRHSDHRRGFNDRDVELIALIARYHRRGEPSTKHGEFAALSESDQQLVRLLAGIVRIAVGGDRSYRGAVESLSVRCAPDNVVITLHDSHGVADLERFAVEERKGLLERTLGRAIQIELSASRRSSPEAK